MNVLRNRQTIHQYLTLCIFASYLDIGNSKEIYNVFIFPPDYVKADAPRQNQSGEMTCVVSINLEVWAVNEISFQKQELEVDLTLTIWWTDYRLTLNSNISSQSQWPVVDKNEAKMIWTPTILFRNCKGCSPLSMHSAENLYVEKATATILAQIRLLRKFACAIDLRAYPMDIQFCQIQLYTFEDTEDAILFKHLYPNKEINMDSNITLAEYYVVPLIKTHCRFTDAEGEVYSCLELRIRLEHLITYHLITAYGPTTFIVILSWIAFWLPLDLAGARVALGLTSLLTLATRLDQAQRNLPPVAYAKAIDVWMFCCIFLVSSSLCEFAFSHYRHDCSKERAKVNSRKIKVQPAPVKKKLPDFSVITARLPSSDQSETYGDAPLDRLSRIIFPLTFLLFNIFYWSYYLTYYN